MGIKFIGKEIQRAFKHPGKYSTSHLINIRPKGH